MKRALDMGNALGFLVALILAGAGASYGLSESSPRIARTAEAEATISPERLPDGRQGLRDAQGVLVPLARYGRIASATLVADRVLADLCERDRIVAFTRYASRTRDAHRYAGVAAISARDSLEEILALAPDLLIASELFDANYTARLRERGIAVFDLGALGGLESLIRSIHTIGALIGEPERAARYAATLADRMRRVAQDGRRIAADRALYIGLYGDRMFGGADRTSYHDVLEYAGFRDVAGRAGMVGWPELTVERLLALDPDVVLTRSGMAALICRRPGLELLGPCRGEGRFIELDGTLLDDPGPGMLDAAEAVRAAALRP